ncbi:hypothetical protein, partial [Bifidobacterium longum]|uniref:hypothetical protein n=1 Tax=Bifidobacterium longum TaxID=216816 RepID=UPI003D0929A0
MSLPTTSSPLPFHPSVRSSMYKALKKKQIKLHCAWRNFRYLVSPPEKGFIATLCTNRTHRRNSS